MSERTRVMALWAPRVLAILVGLFLSVFALDAFDPERGFWASLPGVLLHLVPTYMVAGTIFVAWHRAWFGALIFLVIAAVYTMTTRDRPAWILGIAGPLCVVGLAYLVSWRVQRAPAR